MEKLLSEISEQKQAKVVCLLEKDKKLASRLEEYGFVCGQTVLVVKRFKGVMLVSVRGALLGLDEKTCKRIVVCD
ncbi:MAG: ferrous iron transport protein A [Clostridia bacterium]|nr:ferrous iron transport protein A [Clostridia bacterium]